MIDKVREAIERYSLLEPGESVTVALSGGADSMTLLNILLSLRSEFRLTVSAAHINHGLRGAEADADEAFVAAQCKRLGVPLEILHADVAGDAARNGMGLEECGRKIRYEFLAKVAGSGKIATAHTLSDSAETMLFRLARGSSARGLRGISAVRGNIIRPLILCSRADIEAYCAENHIEYVTDSTNLDTLYARNRIRNNVIPELKKINPGLESALMRAMNMISEDDDYLYSAARKLVSSAGRGESIDLKVISRAAPPIRHRAIRLIILEKTGLEPDYGHISAVEGVMLSGGRTQVCGGYFAEAAQGVLRIYDGSVSAPVWSADFVIGELSCGDLTIKTEVVSINVTNYTQKIDKKILANCVDCDKIVGNLAWGSRAEGDKIKLNARGCTKSLRKLYSEAGIPPSERNAVAVLRDAEGPVFVEGFGSAERCAVSRDTVNAYRFTLSRH